MVTDDDVRRVACSLPAVTEKPSHGAPGFRVGDKLFARIRNESEGGLALYVADLDEKEALLAADEAVFFTTPHYDGYPMILVRMEAVALDELTDLLADAWRVRAPVRIRQANEHLLSGATEPGT